MVISGRVAQMRHSRLGRLILTIFLSGVATAQEAPTGGSVAYKALSTLTLNEQQILYAELPSELRAAVWHVHFQKFLATHPELTVPQRALIEEADGLLRAGIMDMPRDVPEWSAAVGAPLSQLSAKATLLFDRDTVVGLFARLGGESAVVVTAPRAGATARRTISSLSPSPSGRQECDCSHYSDWCWSGSWCNTSMECKSVPFCGTLWSYTCDGMCVTPYP